MFTVSQLIEKLKEFPQDMPVISFNPGYMPEGYITIDSIEIIEVIEYKPDHFSDLSPSKKHRISAILLG